jgi:hypothetical protein
LLAPLSEPGGDRAQFDRRTPGCGCLVHVSLMPSQQANGVRQRCQPRDQLGGLQRVVIWTEPADGRDQPGCGT